ncbi:MAG: hypothetical protein AB7E85_00095 [Pseudobdellovibrionaceae bacterium]
MSFQTETLHEMATAFSNHTEKLYPKLALKFILHHRGQRNDAVELERSFFDSHPAGHLAINILRKSKSTQASAFHGLAVETKRTLFGLKETQYAIGLVTLNLDSYGSQEAVLADMYHLGCHAIEAANLLDDPRYRGKFTSGPLVPKRSPLSLAKANMLADIFSVLVLANQKQHRMIRAISAERCLNTMLPKASGRPWHYPYPVAAETTEAVWKDMMVDGQAADYDPVATPMEVAQAIMEAFEEDSYAQWWTFCEPAQEMAWYGELPEAILGAALNTSIDPLVKANALLIQQYLNVKPMREEDLEGRYNAFLREDQKREQHQLKMDETFELVLAEGLLRESARPFHEAANAQNIRLSEGKIFGWCASALQAAGRAFDQALAEKREPGIVAQLEFNANQKDINYQALSSISKDVLSRRQDGHSVTMDDLHNILTIKNEDSLFVKSIENTMKDPDYKRALEMAKNPEPAVIRAPKGPSPHGPSAAPRMAPQAAPQVSMPGGGMMGGGATATQPATQGLPDAEEDDTDN